MTRERIEEIISKYLKNEASPEEINTLEEFEGFAENKVKDKVFSDIKEKNELKNSISKNVIKHIRVKPKRYDWLKVAASIVVLLSIGISYYYNSLKEQPVEVSQITYVTKKTDWGQKANITLPDGSVVKLNSGSKLSFPSQFNDSLRSVALEGEAFFDVVENASQPFVITSNNTKTTVLGTTFNVDAYPDKENLKVTLATGKVVVNVGKQEVYLLPSDQAVYHKGQNEITTQKVDVQKFLEWKDGVLRFENESLGDAILKLEKWFGVTIELKNKNLANCTFTGMFKSERLQTILEHLVYVKQDVDYKFLSEKEIIITGNCSK